MMINPANTDCGNGGGTFFEKHLLLFAGVRFF
jgi:hypothetical protein